MSVQKKEVTYCTEVDVLLGILVTAIADVKAGKNVKQVLDDVSPQFFTALTGVSELKAEVADHKSLRMTIELKGNELVDVILS